MVEMYRLFIAIDLPDEIKERISKVQKEIIDSDSVFGNFVNIKNSHITLKFIGLMSESELERIKAEISEICDGLGKFEVGLKGLGAFPTETSPRVIWVGLKIGVEKIVELQRKFNKAMLKFGAKSDERFGGHVTLARVKRVRDRFELKDFFDGYRNKEFGRFNLSEIKLMRSQLRREGPIYTVLETFELR